MAHVDKLDVPEPLSLLGGAFREAGHELYLVGGYVRDRMLDEASREQGCDADATTGAHPREIKRLLGPRARQLRTPGEGLGAEGARGGGRAGQGGQRRRPRGAPPREVKRRLGPRAEQRWTVGERFGAIGARVGGYA